MFTAAKAEVFTRGVASDAFLSHLVNWAKAAPDSIFAVNTHVDIYSKVKPELGPWEPSDLIHRRAIMIESLRVLGMFEASGKWDEGVDKSRRNPTTAENAEAGMWQQSWDSRRLDPTLKQFLADLAITGGAEFQRVMKEDHQTATTYASMVLRIDFSNYERIPNGPIHKGDERKKTWPDRPKLWRPEESIYPWLRRGAVEEFRRLLIA